MTRYFIIIRIYMSLDHLQRRYATKKFDPTKKISETDLNKLLETFRLSPSSFGLQGRWLVVVTDSSLRQQLVEHSYGQNQIIDASHLLVLCRRTDVDQSYVDKYIQDIADTRDVELSSLDEYKSMMYGYLESSDKPSLAAWLDKQVYISLGMLMSQTALMHIDSCPMEWFDRSAYDAALSLTDKQLASVVILPIWYRSDEDTYAEAPKVRFPLDHLITTL
jgi:nitroreductase